MSDLNPATKFNLKKADSAADSANGSSVTGDTVADRDYDVINSYNFVLRVEGFQNVPLKAVRGINKQNEYEYIQEGGLNDYIHMVRKPISQPFTFQVERYVSQDWLQDAIDPLANGTELVLPLILYMYRSNNHDGTMPSRYYIFTNCRVTGVQVGDLDAEKSGLHTITNTIAYAQMTIVTLPFVGIDDEMYSFNNNNAENTTNTSHVRTLKDMGITKMAKLNKETDKEPGETDAEFDKRNAAVDYRGNRTKKDMKVLGEKYIFNSNGAGNTTNQERLGLDKYIRERESEIRQYEFTKNGLDPNNENTDSVANPEVTPISKQDMEGVAEALKYQFSTDGKNGNTKNTKNVPAPEKNPNSKKSMEGAAKKNKYKFKKGNKPNPETVNAIKPTNPQLTKQELQNKSKKYSVKNGRNKSAVEDEFEISKTAMQAMAEQHQFHYGDGPSTSVVTQENEPAVIRNEYKFGDAPSFNVVSQENEAAESRNTYKFGDSATENVVSQENGKAEVRNSYKFGDKPTDNVQVPGNQADKKQMESKAKKYPKTSSVVTQENEPAVIRNEYKFGDAPSDNVVSQENKAAELRNTYKFGDRATENVVSQENGKAEVRNSYKFGDKPTNNVQIPSKQANKKQMESKAKKYPKIRSARQVSEFLGRK